MQWMTLVATFLGAAIAMGTALVVQARKDRNDLAAEWRSTRRELYLSFLTVMTQSRSELLALSKKSDLAEADRDEMARQVFARCYEARHHLELVAPDEVSDSALVYFRTIRGLRNLVAAGRKVGDPEWEQNTARAKDTLKVTQKAMRNDLRGR